MRIMIRFLRVMGSPQTRTCTHRGSLPSPWAAPALTTGSGRSVWAQLYWCPIRCGSSGLPQCWGPQSVFPQTQGLAAAEGRQLVSCSPWQESRDGASLEGTPARLLLLSQASPEPTIKEAMWASQKPPLIHGDLVSSFSLKVLRIIQSIFPEETLVKSDMKLWACQWPLR